MGIVTTQEITIFLNNDQSTTSLDLIRPTKTTDPTLQCVVLTGIPKFDASRTVRADPISIAKPLEAQMKKKEKLNHLKSHIHQSGVLIFRKSVFLSFQSPGPTK